jgi:hypothetical protein
VSAASFVWDSGMAEVYLSEAGSYTLSHRLLRHHAGKQLAQASIEVGPIDVVDGAGLQVSEVSLSAETLDEILKHIEGNR